MQIIRKSTAAERIGVSKRTVDRWALLPEYAHLNFPKPVSLGENSVGYISEEIDNWIRARAALRTVEAA